MRELFNGKDAYVIINYSNKTHLIRHNVTRAFEDDYKNGKLEDRIYDAALKAKFEV